MTLPELSRSIDMFTTFKREDVKLTLDTLIEVMKEELCKQNEIHLDNLCIFGFTKKIKRLNCRFSVRLKKKILKLLKTN